MKRLLIIIFLTAVSLLFAASIKEIRAREYYGSVCRLVLDMDQDTDFVIEKIADGFYLGFSRFDQMIPPHNLAGTFLSSIEAFQNGVKIKSREDLAFYTMRLSDSKSIVVDFYKADQSKESRLAIARFNSDKGRLVVADRDFSKLAVDYPNHYDVFYHWAVLLLKRESSRAREKLEIIPESSQYYQRAQQLLGGETLPREPEPEDTFQPPPEMSELNEVVYFPSADPAPAIPETTTAPIAESAQTRSLPYIPILIIVLVTIGLIIVLARFLHRKRALESPNSGIVESSSTMDTNTLTRIVNRLLADGWTTREISREMKVSVQEVEQIIRRLHRTGGIDDDK